jgi:hypothetical protein
MKLKYLAEVIHGEKISIQFQCYFENGRPANQEPARSYINKSEK